MDTLLRQNAELLRETAELRAYMHEHQSDLLKVRDTLKTHLCSNCKATLAREAEVMAAAPHCAVAAKEEETSEDVVTVSGRKRRSGVVDSQGARERGGITVRGGMGWKMVFAVLALVCLVGVAIFDPTGGSGGLPARQTVGGGPALNTAGFVPGIFRPRGGSGQANSSA